MLKKVLLASLLSVTSVSTAFAASIYLTPGAMWQSVSVNSNHYQGISPRVGIGYGTWLTDAVYLAGEIDGALRSIDINNEPKNGYSLKLKYTFGGSVVPGLVLDESIMAFARVGYVFSHFQQLDRGKSGIQLGLGLAANISRCWDVRAEYDYIRYGSFNSVGTPNENDVSLTAVYRFYWL